MLLRSWAPFLLCVAALSAEARLEFGSPFADHAVLQRGKTVHIWGWSDPGDAVTVTFAGQKETTTADGDGAWRVAFKPMADSKEPRELRASSQNASASISDVLVGEVWLCSGQSNMEFSLFSGAPRVRERDGGLTAQMTDRPFIRYMNGSAYQASATPLAKALTQRHWEKLTPGMLSRHGISAVGVLYALELYAALDVPVGIIAAAWGGTQISPWIPREGLQEKPGLEDVLAKIPPVGKGVDKKIAGEPTAIYNALVAPLAPYAMRGIIWYQGESDRRDGKRYAMKMKAYFDGMRHVFLDQSLKLYFCQIAPWKHGGPGYFDVRCQQAEFANMEANAEMVVTSDIGNADEIHPYEKAPVAKRLAAYALRNDYGWRNLRCDYPTPVSAISTGSVAVVRFKHGEDLAIYNMNGKFDLNVELAGPDGIFHRAKLIEEPKAPLFKLTDNELRVASDAVSKPTRIRYLFDSGAFGAIVNGFGLPVGPFELLIRP